MYGAGNREVERGRMWAGPTDRSWAYEDAHRQSTGIEEIWNERRDLHGGRFSGRGPKGYKRSDDRICEDVCDRLTQDPEIDARDLTVNVKNCEVTPEGFVEDRRMKRFAEDCAEDVPGVTQVHNRLRVRPTGGSEAEQGNGRTGLA